MTTVVVACNPVSTPSLRAELITELSRRGLPPHTVEDAALVLTELVSNAVRHGCPLPGGGLRVTWRVDRTRVRVAVSDGGSGGLAGDVGPVEQRPWATGGRGLAIVASLAHDWGVRSGSGSTTVWANVPVCAPTAVAG
ncbi:MAG: ATP-binding protein [Mycobacteriales bacterium]